MLNRRSFLGALAGLPVLGHIMQRAPLPTDTPLVTFGEWGSVEGETVEMETVEMANGSTITFTARWTGWEGTNGVGDGGAWDGVPNSVLNVTARDYEKFVGHIALFDK